MEKHNLLLIKNKKLIDAFKLDREQIKELDRRMKDRQDGNGKSYSLEELEKYLKEKLNHKSQF